MRQGRTDYVNQNTPCAQTSSTHAAAAVHREGPGGSNLRQLQSGEGRTPGDVLPLPHEEMVTHWKLNLASSGSRSSELFSLTACDLVSCEGSEG